jgi:hypothetical protein
VVHKVTTELEKVKQIFVDVLVAAATDEGVISW